MCLGVIVNIMARVKGIFQANGKLGELSFYLLKGKPVMRTITKVSKEHYENAKTMAIVRKNAAEFSGASKAGKALREALKPQVKSFGDSYLSGRLNAVMRAIISEGEGERGERILDVRRHGNLLQGFAFDPERPLAMIIQAPIVVTINAKRNEWTVDIGALNAHYLMVPKGGATHFQFCSVAAVLSNFVFDIEHQSYVPINSEAHGIQALSYGQMLETKVGTAKSTLRGKLPIDGEEATNTALVVCVGISFFQQVNGELYALKGGNAMDVLAVF